MTGGLRAEWVERMRGISALQVAEALGYATKERGQRGEVFGCPIPDHNKGERRHNSTGDKRGTVSVDRKGAWLCIGCDNEKGTRDALSFVSYDIAGRPFQDLRSADPEGYSRVREWCMRHLGMGGGSSPGDYQPPARILKPAPAPAEQPPNFPPADELGAFWNACVRMDAPELPPVVAAWMDAQRIDRQTIAALDLARAIPDRIDFPECVPSWWLKSGYRVVLRTVDAEGKARSMRARNVTPAKPGHKSRPLTGYDAAGLVMACPLALQVLATGQGPEGLVVELCEGEKKFLQRVVEAREGRAEGHTAVVGFASGGWTEEHAERLPDGAAVLLATDPDSGGADHANRIVPTLEKRWRARAVRLFLPPHFRLTTQSGRLAVELQP